MGRDNAVFIDRGDVGVARLEICLVRHGESEANLAGLIQGQGDYGLSEGGRKQAWRTAEALAGHVPLRALPPVEIRGKEGVSARLYEVVLDPAGDGGPE